MKAIKNTGVLLFSEFISKGIAFLLIPFYSFVIEPEDFGLIAILQLFFTIFFLVISYSLSSTFDKFFFDEKYQSLQTLFSNLFLLQIFAILIGSLIYLLFDSSIVTLLDLENKEYLDWIFYTAVIAVFFPLVNSFLICSGQVKKAGLFSILISIIRSVMALLLVLNMEDKVLAILLAGFAEQIVGFLIAVPYYYKHLRLNKISKTLIAESALYASLFFPTSCSTFIVKFSDRFMIQYMLGYQSLGIYSMGTKLVNIPGQFISTVNKNFMPQIYQGISKGDNRLINQLVRLFLAVIFIFIFGLIIFSTEIFYVIGTNYKDSYNIFIILSLCAYINGYNLILQPVMTYFNKYVKYKSMIWVTVGIVNLILNILVIPDYGILGAAGVTTFSYLISIPFSYYYSKKAYKENYYIKWFSFSCLLLIVLSIFMILNEYEESLLSFFVRVIIFTTVGLIFMKKLVSLKALKAKTMLFSKKLLKKK
ncbi:oligosaccharide flippase family protein [Maribacter cobaltidurans]|uniref:Uncharacterized protein n=1 Tax=Maribacter cobaltidurans TaxID=1178778 RepID=A0A223V4G2_9FLAO|nr:oligosaccharide flippase family protein [Maribacter cobaltidurans]ASV30186.1 hypothetical protein CJ263_08105 [Maribacter cobaltidurans]GGD76473.1 hypothetical protein GCM10011412_12760 [Maribacter cobaltidurans]